MTTSRRIYAGRSERPREERRRTNISARQQKRRRSARLRADKRYIVVVRHDRGCKPSVLVLRRPPTVSETK